MMNGERKQYFVLFVLNVKQYCEDEIRAPGFNRGSFFCSRVIAGGGGGKIIPPPPEIRVLDPSTKLSSLEKKKTRGIGGIVPQMYHVTMKLNGYIWI